MRRHNFKAVARRELARDGPEERQGSVTDVARAREAAAQAPDRNLACIADDEGFEHSVSPLWSEPEGFAARVACTACSLCKGSCCTNGDDHAFLDQATIARVRRARLPPDVRAVLRLYIERVPEVAYEGSCIFHGKQGCTLDRSLRSDVCNNYFCAGLQVYMTGGDTVTPTQIIAGVGEEMRTSPILMPSEQTAYESGGISHCSDCS